MTLEEISGQIYRYFLLRNFKWRKNGELVFPSIEDIEEMIVKCAESVLDTKDDISIEVGNIMVKSSGKNIDVYMYVGEIE